MFRAVSTLLIGAAFLAAQEGWDATVLMPGIAIERGLAGGQRDRFSLELRAGEYGGLIVEQRGIDVVVHVADPSGKVIARFDSESRTQGQEIVGLVADSPLTYELRIEAAHAKDVAAAYEIRVVEMRPANDRDRALFEANKLTVEGQRLAGAGKYEEAIVVAERALALGETALGPDDAYVGSLLIKLGSFHRNKGNYTKAEPLFRRAVAVSEKALGREHPQTALALRWLGLLYMSIADYAKADRLMQEALEINERVLGKEHPAIVEALLSISALHMRRRDFKREVSELQRALGIAEKTLDPDDPQVMRLVGNLGDAYSLQGDNQRAEPLLERSLAMAEKIYGENHPFLAIPLQNLGIVARETKRYARAREFLLRALALNEKSLGPRHPETAAVLINIGNLYNAEQNFAKGVEFHQRALEILSDVVGPYNRLTLAALNSLALSYAAQGDVARAIEYRVRCEQAMERSVALNLDIGSEREKLAYLDLVAGYTAETISLSARQAPDDLAARELAVLVVLQRKGRVLDAMSGSLAALRERLDLEDRKLLEELSETNARLANVALSQAAQTPAEARQGQLAQLESRREKLEAAVSERSAAFRAQSQPVTLAAVRAALPPGAALIEYFTYVPIDPQKESQNEALEDPRYIVYVLRAQGGVEWRDLGPAKEIDDAVAVLRGALRDGQSRNVLEHARSLDRRVIEPVRALAGDATQLLISPDGALNLIPFEALVDEKGRYLVERYSINYLTTGRDLLRMQVARASKTGPLILANPLFGEPASTQMARAGGPKPNLIGGRRSITTGPDMTSVYFAPLAGTAEEARSIQSLFPEAEVLTGPRATKTSLKRAQAPSILHIATHGFFLEDSAGKPVESRSRAIQANIKLENPLLRSGLAFVGANLSKGRDDDGILTALEASSLNLWGTKVVTLSACETGVGEVKNGEGVYGLRRAFLLAGAETLVMSLWPVSDRVTREMMAAYYSGLKKGLGRGEALRQEQLAMLKRNDRRHPFYWASFIQSGDWKNLGGR